MKKGLDTIIKSQIQTTPFGGKYFFKPGEKANLESIEKKEKELGVVFLSSYKEFIQEHGNAHYFGIDFLPIENLYRFDKENWEMEGFIPFGKDISGNYFAFGKDGRTIYYCSHDPFGNAEITDDFEQFLADHYFSLLLPKVKEVDTTNSFYKLDERIKESWKKYQKEVGPKGALKKQVAGTSGNKAFLFGILLVLTYLLIFFIKNKVLLK